MGGRDEWENKRWEVIEAEARRRRRVRVETPVMDDEDVMVAMDMWSVREIWAEVKHELAHELTLRQWRMIQNVTIDTKE
jgi:hypothetical protein